MVSSSSRGLTLMRRQALGPLDPIYNVKTKYGAVDVGNSPGVSIFLPNAVHWWDFSNASSRVDSGSNIVSIADLINSATMTAQGTVGKVTTVGGQGLTSAECSPQGGGAPQRMLTANLLLTSQPMWASWVGLIPDTPNPNGVWFDLSSAGGARPHAYTFGAGWVINAGVALGGSVLDDTNTHIFYAEYNGASSKLYIDGALTDSGNAGSGSANADATLFNVVPGGVGGTIRIGEIVMGTSTNTAADITAEYNRLLAKWI